MAKGGVVVEEPDQIRQVSHLVLFGSPVEGGGSVYHDLVAAEPFDPVGDTEGSGRGGQRAEGGAMAGEGGGDGGQSIVVVRLGELNQGAVAERGGVAAREILLQLVAIEVLEDLRVGPVESRLPNQLLHHLELAAQSFEHEDGIGVLAPDLGHDIFPDGAGDHIAGIAAEAVDAASTPEEENIGHLVPQSPLRVVQLREVLPGDAPGAGGDKGVIVLAGEPVGVVGLET